MATLNVDECRAKFPSLKGGYIFADNAGGSQCLKSVVDAVSDYLLNTNVQLGADYSVSVESTQRVGLGSIATAELVNADADEIVFGSSSTALVENLARAMDGDIQSTDEFIISDADHEANAGPWKRLAARRGLNVQHWIPVALSPNENPYAVSLRIEDLLPLVTAQTRLVAFTACSNILGELVDVKKVVAALRAKAKELGTRKLEVCVDCVAYAPHRRIDVRDWDADYVFFSYYKVYGPHASVMYTRRSSRDDLASLAHYFLTAPTYKLAVGGSGYELTYGCSAVLPYLSNLAGKDDLNASFAAITRHEKALMEPLIGYLLSDEAKARGVRIVGPEGVDGRVPTVSFVVVGDKPFKSKEVVAEFDKRGNIGIRFGHFYAYTLLKQLDLTPEDGVVRISLVHLNTVEEVEKIVSILKEVLA
ncbi:PLP-dependent transferase [Exidia glandulosa HHB12029]|uniref:PLP-dependent transferase n=1 Tax=Exidia glandulosa HHB12029 TaxID=1314781 RepID=A0A165L395_EXIGL|nr:PLP-dependent transferase [Exidia glandulosa HHB12029]